MWTLIFPVIFYFLLPQKFQILFLVWFDIGRDIRIDGAGKLPALCLTDLELLLCHLISPPKITLYFSKSISYDNPEITIKNIKSSFRDYSITTDWAFGLFSASRILRRLKVPQFSKSNWEELCFMSKYFKDYSTDQNIQMNVWVTRVMNYCKKNLWISKS